jgi:hypothetical protein
MHITDGEPSSLSPVVASYQRNENQISHDNVPQIARRNKRFEKMSSSGRVSPRGIIILTTAQLLHMIRTTYASVHLLSKGHL